LRFLIAWVGRGTATATRVVIAGIVSAGAGKGECQGKSEGCRECDFVEMNFADFHSILLRF
jgi:hypothetical protein